MAGAGAMWSWWEKDGGFGFRGALGRVYEVPFGVELTPRNPAARKGGALGALAADDVGGAMAVWATPPRSRIAFESLEKDYDLTPFLQVGEPMGEREERERRERADEPNSALPPDPSVALAPLAFDGDTLEVVELDGEGWVSFPSLLRPFGKRADSYMGLVDGWARVRFERVPSRTGAFDGRGGGLQKTTLLHFEDAPLAIARLERRGMDDDTKAKHTRYLKECAKALADYFLRGRAENPRAAGAGNDLPPWVRGLFEAVGGAAVAAQQTAAAAGATAGAAARAAGEAKEDAAAARATADEARAVAEEAREAARAAVADPTSGVRAGGSRRVPEGTVAREPPPGFVSRREVARRFALPTTGAGASLVSTIAEMARVEEIEGGTCLSDVVIGGVVRATHLRYGPLAIDAMSIGLRAAHATMRALGYHAELGALAPDAGFRGRRRSPSFVLRHAIEAAARAMTPDRREPQQPIPGVENDTASKAS